MAKQCPCGKPGEVVYSGLCEDCWVDAQHGRLDKHQDGTFVHLLSTGSVVTPHAQEFGKDRHWYHRCPKPGS